jgi:hypothetical protein
VTVVTHLLSRNTKYGPTGALRNRKAETNADLGETLSNNLRKSERAGRLRVSIP